MFADMAVNAKRDGSAASAETAVARLGEMSPDLRGCAILDADGRAWRPPATASDGGAPARRSWPPPTPPADEPVTHAHVATEDGEAFALRHEGLAMVAVAERFTLASLMFFDMRAVLRDLIQEAA